MGEVSPKPNKVRFWRKMKKFKNELFHFRGFACPGVLGFLKNSVFQILAGEKYKGEQVFWNLRLESAEEGGEE